MPVLSEHVRLSHVQNHQNYNTWFIFCNFHMYTYFICTRTVETMNKSSSSVFVALWYEQILTCFIFSFWGNNEEFKGKHVTTSSPMFPFFSYSVTFSLSGWLLPGNNTIRKEYGKNSLVVPFFFRMLLLSTFEACSGSNGKCGLSAVSMDPLVESYV